MSFTDKILHKCPYCGYQASVESFATWKKDGKTGLLGKTPEGFIVLLCPECNGTIKYDTLGKKFLKPDDIAKRTFRFNFIVFAIIALIIIYLLLKFVF